MFAPDKFKFRHSHFKLNSGYKIRKKNWGYAVFRNYLKIKTSTNIKITYIILLNKLRLRTELLKLYLLIDSLTHARKKTATNKTLENLTTPNL